MEYTITKLNRTVTLNDELVEKYCEYETLREQPFCIVIRSTFGHAPSVEEVSDEELSALCNEILLDELKALALLPQALISILENSAEIHKASKAGKMLEYKL